MLAIELSIAIFFEYIAKKVLIRCTQLYKISGNDIFTELRFN